MKICEQGVTFFEHCPLDSLGFLDLDDHFSRFKNLLRIRQNPCPGRFEIAIIHPDTVPRRGFNENLMAVLSQFTNRRRNKTYTIFMVFDFLGDTDYGLFLSGLGLMIFGLMYMLQRKIII